MPEPIDAEVMPDGEIVEKPLLPAVAEAKSDAAQARIDAVANVLHKAYEKASLLQLSSEEVAALTSDFADADFRTGASGKENLIYIEHASLRERFNKVIGIGQWSLIVRNRWTEQFTTAKKEPAHRVYVEAVMVVRGCYAGEAIGDMTYYPNNPSTNFGDAVEGAKSAALRRCAKELGVGLQAWHKAFAEDWFKRRGQKPPNGNQPAPDETKEKTRVCEEIDALQTQLGWGRERVDALIKKYFQRDSIGQLNLDELKRHRNSLQAIIDKGVREESTEAQAAEVFG